MKKNIQLELKKKYPTLLHEELNLLLNIITEYKINKIPDLELNKKGNIISLYLDGFKIIEIPLILLDLKKLKKLTLRNNLIKQIPGFLSEASNLVYLNVNYNQIKSVEDEFISIPNLKFLSIGNNMLKIYPHQINEIQTLEELYLECNAIPKIPKTVNKLSNLRIIDLRFNELYELPPEFFQLGSLEQLNLSQNYFKSLSEKITNLTNLKTFHLIPYRFQKCSYPTNLSKLDHLKHLILNEGDLQRFYEDKVRMDIENKSDLPGYKLIEKMYNVKIPLALINFAERKDYLKRKKGDELTEIDFYTFNFYEKKRSIFHNSLFLRWDDVIPIASINGGNWEICLNYREGLKNEPLVVLWDHEAGWDPVREWQILAPFFKAFLKKGMSMN